jgi:DNA invertase Pin-like site-specific DNA recombinase
MDVTKILSELREERQQIEEAILSLERLARGRGRRRGRPPSWMSDTAAPKRRGRPPGSKNKNTAGSATAKGVAVA